eukprot:gene132-189_t
MWGDYLPMVQRIINAQVHESIGVSPIELLYGNAISLDRRHLFSTHVTETEQSTVVEGMNDSRYSDWVDRMLNKQRIAIETAIKHQCEKDTFHIQTYSTKRTEFPNNSYVLQRYENDEHRPPHKFNTTLR